MTPLSLLPFPSGNASRIPLLLDTDIGSNVDDLLALLFTLGSTKLDLVGVATVHGNTGLRAKVAHSGLAMAGRPDVPVGYGIETPLSGKPVFWAGHEGEGYNLSKVPEPGRPASSLYEAALAEHGSNLVVAAIGPLANVVTALQSASTMPRCVVAMAGQFGWGSRNTMSARMLWRQHNLWSWVCRWCLWGLSCADRCPMTPQISQRSSMLALITR